MLSEDGWNNAKPRTTIITTGVGDDRCENAKFLLTTPRRRLGLTQGEAEGVHVRRLGLCAQDGRAQWCIR
jgi:hypothetical protein